MTYFQTLRDDWIIETIRIFGFIQARHLCAKFGISPQQATKYFRRVKENNPDLLTYDVRLKAYRTTDPIFPKALILRIEE